MTNPQYKMAVADLEIIRQRQQTTVDTVGFEQMYQAYLLKSKSDSRYHLYPDRSISFFPGLKLSLQGKVELV